MPETLIETSTYTTDIVVPIGTDKRKALTVRTPFLSLTNRTKYLKQTLDNAVGTLTGTVTIVANIVSGAQALSATTVTGKLTRGRPHVNHLIHPNADFDYDPTTGKELIVSYNISADRICKLLSAGAFDGQHIRIVNNAAPLLTVRDVALSDLIILSNTATGSASGKWRWADFVWDAGLALWLDAGRGF